MNSARPPREEIPVIQAVHKPAPTPGTHGIMVRISEFKSSALKLLPSGHPLLALISGLPDELTVEEARIRFDDWVRLLEA